MLYKRETNSFGGKTSSLGRFFCAANRPKGEPMKNKLRIFGIGGLKSLDHMLWTIAVPNE